MLTDGTGFGHQGSSDGSTGGRHASWWVPGETGEGRFLKRLALAGTDSSRWRGILVNRFGVPVDIESRVVLASCLHRVGVYALSRSLALESLQALFDRQSNHPWHVPAEAWFPVLEYLFGLEGIATCAHDLSTLRVSCSDVASCRAFLALCRTGLAFDLPGATGRDCLHQWLLLEDWDSRHALEERFRMALKEGGAGESAGVSDDPDTARRILSSAEALFREDPLVPERSWIDEEFRLERLIAPLDSWVAEAVCLEYALPGGTLSVLRESWNRREEIMASTSRREDLLMDLATYAPGLPPGRIEEIAFRVLTFRVDPGRLFEPARIAR